MSVTYKDPSGNSKTVDVELGTAPTTAAVDELGARPAPRILRHVPTSSDAATTVGTMELESPMAGRALVVIVDDRTAHGDLDSTGPLVTETLTEAGFLWTRPSR